jgi:hypothetical protein
MTRSFGESLFVVASLLVGLAFVNVVRADNQSAARRCAEIATDLDRLACYDGLFATPPRPNDIKSPVPVNTDAPAAAVPTTIAATAAHASDDPRRDFGLSEADKQRQGNLPAAPDSISVTIQFTDRQSTGEQVFKTQDGQVWVEIEPSSRVRVEPGETVMIRKAALGSYMLVTSKRVGVKVRRVN